MGEYVEKIFPLLGVRFIAVNDNVDNLVSPYDVSIPIKNLSNLLATTPVVPEPQKGSKKGFL